MNSCLLLLFAHVYSKGLGTPVAAPRVPGTNVINTKNRKKKRKKRAKTPRKIPIKYPINIKKIHKKRQGSNAKCLMSTLSQNGYGNYNLQTSDECTFTPVNINKKNNFQPYWYGCKLVLKAFYWMIITGRQPLPYNWKTMITKKGRTNRRNTGKISAARSTKTTRMLTIPGCN